MGGYGRKSGSFHKKKFFLLFINKYQNKNFNIYKSKAQEITWTNIDKCGAAANEILQNILLNEYFY